MNKVTIHTYKKDPPTDEDYLKLRKDLESLLNRYSIDNFTNTPDFILADFLLDSIKSWISITHNNEQVAETEMEIG